MDFQQGSGASSGNLVTQTLCSEIGSKSSEFINREGDTESINCWVKQDLYEKVIQHCSQDLMLVDMQAQTGKSKEKCRCDRLLKSGRKVRESPFHIPLHFPE